MDKFFTLNDRTHHVVVGYSLGLDLILSSDRGLCSTFMPALIFVLCWNGPTWAALSCCADSRNTLPHCLQSWFKKITIWVTSVNCEEAFGWVLEEVVWRGSRGRRGAWWTELWMLSSRVTLAVSLGNSPRPLGVVLWIKDRSDTQQWSSILIENHKCHQSQQLQQLHGSVRLQWDCVTNASLLRVAHDRRLGINTQHRSFYSCIASHKSLNAAKGTNAMGGEGESNGISLNIGLCFFLMARVSLLSLASK